jgi:hypothetical protein
MTLQTEYSEAELLATAKVEEPLIAGGVRCHGGVRADETPHVEYLRTTLSEMRDRTWVGLSGRHYPGADMVGRVYEKCLNESLGTRRYETLRVALGEVEHALDGNRQGDTILEAFPAAGSIRPAGDGTWVSAAGDHE